MNNELFKHLVECNAEGSWEHVRDIVAVQLMGEKAFPIPFIRDASSFEMGHVIMRGDRTIMQKLMNTWTSSLSVGPLSRFVNEEHAHCLRQMISNARADKTAEINPAFEFHESDMRNGVKKTITVQLWDCEKSTMEYLPQDMVIDVLKRGYVNIRKIHLITEVFYVKQIKIHIGIGDQEDTFDISGRFPAGFSLMRYKINPDGTLHGDYKQIRPSSWKAHWVHCNYREPDDPIPLEPLPCSLSKELEDSANENPAKESGS